MEITDLPGNDASWYQALLDEDSGTKAPATPSLFDPTSDEPASEIGATEPIAGVTPTDDGAEDPPVADPISAPPDTTTASFTTPPASIEEVEPSSTSDDDPVADDDDGTSESAVATVTTAADPDDLDVADAAEDLEAATSPSPPLFATGSREVDELSPMEKTSEMVGQMWTARQPEGPLAGWEPDEMDRKMSSSRPFRWTSVGAALAVVALIVVGLVLLPSIARSRAANHMEMMTSSLYELRAELPDTQASLQVATEPGSTVTALDDLSTQLTSLSAKATAVNNAGRSPLPAVPPLTSSTPIDELIPVQQRLEPLATTALTIQRRIANLVQYRTLMHDFLVLPELPNSADNEGQADLRVALASAQAESASILAELPDDVSLSEHMAMAREINDRFATWQVDYLEALRTEDTIAADGLISELLSSLDALDAELVTPLAQIRRQTDADLIDLAAAIDSVVSLAAENDPLP